MKSKIPLYIFLVVPVAIALLQIYLNSTSDLVSWRGGGFGMYSDPHTNSSRKLWIVGKSNGVEKAVRLSPLDERLINKECSKDQFYDDTWEFDDLAWDFKDFPSAKDMDELRNYYSWYIEEYELESAVSAYFPKDSLHLVVMQQAIAPGFKNIETKVLSNLKFE